jgi:hypothetical protein
MIRQGPPDIPDILTQKLRSKDFSIRLFSFAAIIFYSETFAEGLLTTIKEIAMTYVQKDKPNDRPNSPNQPKPPRKK